MKNISNIKASKADMRLFLILMSLIPFIISITVRCINQPEPKAKVELVSSVKQEEDRKLAKAFALIYLRITLTKQST